MAAQAAADLRWHTAHCGCREELGQERALELGCLYQGWAGVAVGYFCGVRGHFPEPGDSTDGQEVRTASGLLTQLTPVPLCSPEAAG